MANFKSEASSGRGGQRMVQVSLTLTNRVSLIGFLGKDAGTKTTCMQQRPLHRAFAGNEA
jgi:hypothetical protein